ncbi:hypothetical protein Tco_0421405 [Tanacetum coccineum]
MVKNRTNTDTGTKRVQKSRKIAINGQHSQLLVNPGQTCEDKTPNLPNQSFMTLLMKMTFLLKTLHEFTWLKVFMDIHSISTSTTKHKDDVSQDHQLENMLEIPRGTKSYKRGQGSDLSHLLCDVESRLGTRGVDEIKVEDPQSAVPKVGPWRKMLTSKDSNFIGYTKKLDMLKLVGASGMLLKQFCFSNTGHLSKTNYAPSFYKV